MFDVNSIPVNKFVVIGSFATNHRTAKDVDIICMKSDINVEVNRNDDYTCYFEWQGKKIECLLADNQESLKFILDDCDENVNIASPLICFCIKAGHINFDHISWNKHIHDYHHLKSVCNSAIRFNVVIEQYVRVSDLIKMHYNSTCERIGKQRLPSLKNKTIGDFFDDGVKKYIVHDELHIVYAHDEIPMYQKMQLNPELVDCDLGLWNKFTHQQKIKAILEEAYVIATERMIVPSIIKDRKYNTKDAFLWSMKRICTTLTQGWFREFAVNNYFEILNYHDPKYFEKNEEQIKGMINYVEADIRKSV